MEYGYRGSSPESPPGGSGKGSGGLALPARITLRGEGAVVRIAIRDWRID